MMNVFFVLLAAFLSVIGFWGFHQLGSVFLLGIGVVNFFVLLGWALIGALS